MWQRVFWAQLSSKYGTWYSERVMRWLFGIRYITSLRSADEPARQGPNSCPLLKTCIQRPPLLSRLRVVGVCSWKLGKETGTISFPELRSPWPAVGERELWEHPFQACRGAIDTIDADCAMRSETGYAEFGHFLCYFKMDAPRLAPRALVFRPLVKGNEALGKRLKRGGNGKRWGNGERLAPRAALSLAACCLITLSHARKKNRLLAAIY